MGNKRFKGLLLACLALALCLNALGLGALAEERMEVEIPVVARGADCTVALLDATGREIQTLPLKAGEEKLFTVLLDRLGSTKYILRLKDEDTDEIDFDSTVYNVELTLYNRDDGKLGYVVVIHLPGKPKDKLEVAEFVNIPRQTAVSIDPPVKKVVTGSPATPGVFTFELRAVSNTAGLEKLPMPRGSEAQLVTIQITGAGEKEFGPITFTQPGTYVYAISEQRGSATGYTYDAAAYTVTATVAKGDRGLEVAMAITRDGRAADGITFTNVYTAPSASPSVSPSASASPSPSVSPSASGSAPSVSPTPTTHSPSDGGGGGGSGSSPRTGDVRNLALWIGVSVALLLLIAALAAYYLRSRRRNKR